MIRCGLIGYGAWGCHHARVIAAEPRASLVAIAVHSEASRQRALAGLLALLGKPAQTAEALDEALLRAMDRLLKAAESWDKNAETLGTNGALETVRKIRNDFAPARPAAHPRCGECWVWRGERSPVRR